jgi:hypothetical protein
LLKSAILPVATAAAGAAAGVIGGAAFRRKVQSPRKVLGVPVPGLGSGVEKLGEQVGEAAKQFSRLANEVRVARERAEKIAKAFS